MMEFIESAYLLWIVLPHFFGTMPEYDGSQILACETLKSAWPVMNFMSV